MPGPEWEKELLERVRERRKTPPAEPPTPSVPDQEPSLLEQVRERRAAPEPLAPGEQSLLEEVRARRAADQPSLLQFPARTRPTGPVAPEAPTTEERGQARLAELRHQASVLATPLWKGSRFGRTPFGEIFDLVQGGAELGGGMLREGLGNIGRFLRNPLDPASRGPTLGGTAVDPSMAALLGRHLAAPARERIPLEMAGDPLNVFGLGAGKALGGLATRGIGVLPGLLGRGASTAPLVARTTPVEALGGIGRAAPQPGALDRFLAGDISVSQLGKLGTAEQNPLLQAARRRPVLPTLAEPSATQAARGPAPELAELDQRTGALLDSVTARRQRLTNRVVVRASKLPEAARGGEDISSGWLTSPKLWEALMFWKLLPSGGEMSVMLRQALLPTVGHPKEAIAGAKGTLRGAFSEETAQAFQESMKMSPRFEEARRASLDFTELGGGLARRGEGGEELFSAPWAREIPLVGNFIKMSERLFSPYSNYLRLGIFDTYKTGWEKVGKHLTVVELDKQARRFGFQDMKALGTLWRAEKAALLRAKAGKTVDMRRFRRLREPARNLARFEAAQFKETQRLAQVINLLTGRGSLGPLEKWRGPLTVVFWAPRLLVSYPELVYAALRPSTSGAVRKLIARDAAITIGTGMLILWLAKLRGADVDNDARSSDFGKIRVGPTRINVWGGWQIYARSMVQAATGQRKGTGTGEIGGVSFADITLSFLRNKLAPAPGLAVDVLPALVRGETPTTAVGEEFGADWESLGNQAINRLAPLWYQDLLDAWREGGWESIALTLPGFFGVGTQSFRTPIEEFTKEQGFQFEPRQMTSSELSLLRRMMKAAEPEKVMEKQQESLERQRRQQEEDIRRIQERAR